MQRSSLSVPSMLVDAIDLRELAGVESGRALRVVLTPDAGFVLGSIEVAVRIYEGGRDRDFATPKVLTAAAPAITIDADDMIGLVTLAFVVTTAAAAGTRVTFTITSDPIV